MWNFLSVKKKKQTISIYDQVRMQVKILLLTGIPQIVSFLLIKEQTIFGFMQLNTRV